MASRPASGGARQVDVPAERLERWLSNFAERHGEPTHVPTTTGVTLTAPDGTTVECVAPFAPVSPDAALPYNGLLQHVVQPRRVGVLLVRLGGYAVGIFEGTTLVTSKVGSKTVHGRNSNGGWSQHRYARRRDGQVKVALQESTDVAARILGGQELDALVTGGEKSAIAAVLEDPRLKALQIKIEPRVLDVPDPKLVVLQQTPAQFRAVRMLITDPATP